MWFDVIDVRKGNLGYLGQELSGGKVLEMRYDPESENVSDLRSALCSVLEHTVEPSESWIFSSLSPLLDRRNLSLLSFLGQNEALVRLALREVVKAETHYSMPSTELSFACTVPLLRRLFETEKLDADWDFCLGGWLVKDSFLPRFLRRWKFEKGFIFPDSEARLGFCSSEDWDCIKFFSSDVSKISELATIAAQCITSPPTEI